MTRAPAVPPFQGLTDKKLRSLGQKLDKLADPNGFKHSSLLRKSADDSAGLVWHLARHGLVGVAMQSAGLLNVLAERVDEASGADAIAALRRLPDDLGALDRGKAREWTMLTPGMLADVDKLVVHAYVHAREALLAARAEVGENLRTAIDFVRRRAGEPIADDVAAVIFKHLAEQHCEYGLALNIDVPRIVGGQVEAFHLADTAAVRSLALLFGTEPAWDEAVLGWLLPRVREFRMAVDTLCERALDGLRIASLTDLVYLFGDGYWSGENLLRVLDARGDSPAELFAVASRLVREGLGPLRVAVDQLPEKGAPRGRGGDDEVDDEEESDGGDDDYADDYDGGDEESDEDDDVEAEEPGPDDDRVRGLAEGLTIVGVERLGDAAVPAELDGNFELRRVYESEARYVARLRGAIARLGPTRAHAVVRRVLARPFVYGRAVVLADVHLDPAVVREIFNAVDAGEYGVDAGLLGMCGPAIVPLAAEQAANTTSVKSAAGYREAILYVLARATAWDPSWDVHVHLDQVRFSYGGSKVEPVLAMLQGLPLARHEAILRRNMDRCADEPWRLVRCLRIDSTEALMEEVFAGVLARHKSVTSGSLGGGLRALDTRVVAPLLRAFGATPAEGTLMRELERALDDEAFARLEAGLGRPIETKEQELRRLADGLPGPKIRVYRLTRGESPVGDAVARIGGQPRGVVSPPEHAGEPMQHVITLDLARMPELAAQHPGIRSLSLYVPDLDDAEMHEEGVIVWTHEDELGSADGSTDGAAALVVEGFDVPEALFGRATEGDLKRVRELLYGASGHVRGGPLWLQDGFEGIDADFLLQFDESLCHINLGDMGVMYVFGDRITWQCH